MFLDILFEFVLNIISLFLYFLLISWPLPVDGAGREVGDGWADILLFEFVLFFCLSPFFDDILT